MHILYPHLRPSPRFFIKSYTLKNFNPKSGFIFETDIKFLVQNHLFNYESLPCDSDGNSKQFDETLKMKRVISSLVKPQILASTGRGFTIHAIRKTGESLMSKRRYSSESEVCEKTNMCSAINDALRIAMTSDPTSIVFGEDVAFGGVFRCSIDLQDMFGKHRVFNTPICEYVVESCVIQHKANPL